MWLYALKVSALGMAVVFTALIMLMILIKAQSFLLDLFVKEDESRKEEKLLSIFKTKTPIELVDNEDDFEDDPEELVAVISAAIFALGHQVSIKKITRTPSQSGLNWSQANRIDAMNTRKR